MAGSARRVAVVLFNLGAPDGPDAIRPFLFNLFSDPSILQWPGIIRWPLAWFIARTRMKEARKLYGDAGDDSPLLANTRDQVAVLQTCLGTDAYRVFTAMRHWYPMADEAADQVSDFNPDQVVLLPLYPQYAAATTASSVRAWMQAARAWNVTAPTVPVCCYPAGRGFVDASVALIRTAYDRASALGRPRLLLSAHAIPEATPESADPYRRQCQATAEAIVDGLGTEGLDWVTCFQGRLGPVRWAGPSTRDAVMQAGQDGVPVVIYPMSFVSEQCETLVEIETLCRRLALEAGVPHFERVPTVGTHPDFIAGLAELVRSAVTSSSQSVANAEGARTCPVTCSGCPWPRRGT